MILVDTSVWIEHLRYGHARLERALIDGEVLTHPFVVGELACSSLADRAGILSLLGSLRVASVAEHAEVLRFVDGKQLHGRGIGWVDAHLLASSILTPCPILTFDKALLRVAQALHTAAD
jgi:predicted nucleic acid-binding protein